MKASETLLQTVFQLCYARKNEPDAGDDLRRHKTHIAVSETLRDFGQDRLTARERILVQQMLKGHSAKEMARILDITPGTASIHRSNIYRQMQVTSTGELFGVFLDNVVARNG